MNYWSENNPMAWYTEPEDQCEDCHRPDTHVTLYKLPFGRGHKGTLNNYRTLCATCLPEDVQADGLETK